MAFDTILPKEKHPGLLRVGLETLNIRSPFKISRDGMKQEAVVVVFYLRARINERERECVRKIEI